MTTRTTNATVTFRNAFHLLAFDAPQPAGTYRLVMDDEEIIGLTFLALRRIATVLQTPAIGSNSARVEHTLIDQADLTDALARDQRLIMGEPSR